MLTYLTEDPDYKQQFSEVYLYKDWAELQTGYDANDIGIDLVAKERHGGYCAIQCKCYAEDTRISKPALDSFIAASASERFTSRLIVDTGGEWGPNALRTIDPIKDKLRIIRYSDLESSPFDWPDLSLHDPEQLTYKQRRFHLKDHQKEAFDDVINGFKEATTAANSLWRAARVKPSQHSESLRQSPEPPAECYISCRPSVYYHRRCGNGQNNAE